MYLSKIICLLNSGTIDDAGYPADHDNCTTNDVGCTYDVAEYNTHRVLKRYVLIINTLSTPNISGSDKQYAVYHWLHK